MIDFIVNIFLIVAPLYFANACALLFGGTKRIDCNMTFFDGAPLLGEGKTFRGTAAGILAGLSATVIIYALLPLQTTALTQNYLLFGSLLTVGAVIGDMAASFIKRRLKGKRGQSFPLLDQLDFVVGGLSFAGVVRLPTVTELGFILALTLVMHVLTNHIAFRLKLKNVPW